MADRGDDDIDMEMILREEAHRTVDNQINTLNDIDSKVARILRINLVILGILLTGLSVATAPESQPNQILHYTDLINNYTIAGVSLLLLSTGVAAITYTASSLQSGLAATDLRNLLNNDYTDRQNLEGIVEGYSEWIEYNYRTNAKNAPLGTLTILLLVYSMAWLALGVKKAATGDVEPWLVTVTVLLSLTVMHFTGFVGQVRRWHQTRNN
ncbi:hypothetical protein SAMN05216559_2304 [Halomicrobium zhouii]|uniref:Uncharacterized protein n=1 Tax=Halomicrobium zhouii TaxID=767519 RepID=A0A1I6L992_9EURY|nr:hypothetical protein [Halomicrobium zhouii]SFS00063.1 hypothetical protein SAMN05216559_2304 [Halomicrobium zhouii]